MDKPDLDKTAGFFVIVFFTVLISLLAYLVISNPPISLFPNRNSLPELTITNLEFTIGDASIGKIIISAVNSGNVDITVSEIKVNGETANSWEATNPKITIDATETYTITHEITTGNKYTITLFSSADGQMLGSYTKTA